MGLGGPSMVWPMRSWLPIPLAGVLLLWSKHPWGVQLHPRGATLDELPPQSVHQPVGASVQEQPELVGDEAVAAQPIRFYVQFQIFYPVLPFSTAGVELVESLRSVASGSEDKAPVGPLLHDLGLVDHPALVLPAPRLVDILTEEPGLVRRQFVVLGSFFEQILGHLQKAFIGYEGDSVGYALTLAVVVDGRNSEAGVRLQLYLHPGPSFPQASRDALQQGHRRVGGMGVSRSQKRRDEVPRLAVKD